MARLRNLRLLVLDDQPSALKDQALFFARLDLDLVDLRVGAPFTSYKGPGVARWPQLVRALEREATGKVGPLSTWDLLIADLLFVGDEEAPKYPIDWDPSKKPDEECPNGLGLVHALALLACRARNNAPFGWALRSANGGALAADPIALLTYGLLEGLNGSPPGGDDAGPLRPGKLEEDFANRLRAMPPTTILDGAWRRALRSYRRALIEGAQSGRWAVSWSGDYREWVTAFDEERSSRTLGRVGLDLEAGGSRARIRLSSLFADCVEPESRTLRPDRREAIDDFFRALQPMQWPAAEELLSAHDRASGTPPASSSNARMVAGRVVLAWIDAYYAPNKSYEREELAAGAVSSREMVTATLDMVGIPQDLNGRQSNDYQTVRRALKSLGRTPTQLLQDVRGGSLPANSPSLLHSGRALLARHEVTPDAPDYPIAFRIGEGT